MNEVSYKVLDNTEQRIDLHQGAVNSAAPFFCFEMYIYL